jgi:hypothetical protein
MSSSNSFGILSVLGQPVKPDAAALEQIDMLARFVRPINDAVLAQRAMVAGGGHYLVGAMSLNERESSSLLPPNHVAVSLRFPFDLTLFAGAWPGP